MIGASSRHPADDFNAGFGETIELGRVVGEQDDARAFEHLEHARGNAIVALIVIEAKRGVCIDGIEAVVLQPIGAHLVGEADAAAFLRQIENNAAAKILEPRHREPKLVAAVTAPRTKYVARQACRMQPHGDGLVKSGLPTIMATSIPPMASRKTMKRALDPELSGTDGFARQRQRLNRVRQKNFPTASASTVMISGSL